MTERERVVRILSDLNLPRDQYVVNGSGSLILHGITAEERGKPMGDLDIFCATRLWMDMLLRRVRTSALELPEQYPLWKVWATDPKDPALRCDPPYLYADMYGLEVDVFHGWRRRAVGNFDVAHYILNAEDVDGWPCVPLQWILDWKREVGRAKDLDDIRVLEERLGAAA